MMDRTFFEGVGFLVVDGQDIDASREIRVETVQDKVTIGEQTEIYFQVFDIVDGTGFAPTGIDILSYAYDDGAEGRDEAILMLLSDPLTVRQLSLVLSGALPEGLTAGNVAEIEEALNVVTTSLSDEEGLGFENGTEIPFADIAALGVSDFEQPEFGFFAGSGFLSVGEFDVDADREILVSSPDGTFQMGALEDGDFTITDLATGAAILPDRVDAYRLDYDGAEGTETVELLTFADDETGIRYTTVYSGAFPEGFTVDTVADLLDEVNAVQTQLNTDPESEFADGTVFDFADLAALEVREAGGVSLADAQTVALLYEAALDRNGEIDLDGLNFWIDEFEGGMSISLISLAFLQSDEFEESFGNATDPEAEDYLSDAELVDVMYRNILDREGEEAGEEFWTEALDIITRSDLLLAFAQSTENVEGSPDVENLTEYFPGEWVFA